MVCPFHLASEQAEVEGQTYQCGILRLPQDRSKPDGLQIGIAFVLLKSWSDNPLPDPLLSLEGGPGASALEIAALRAREFIDRALAGAGSGGRWSRMPRRGRSLAVWRR